MNRPIGMAVGIGVLVVLALGAVASKIGAKPTPDPATTSAAGTPADRAATIRRSGRSAFAQSDAGARGFAPVSSVTTKSAPAPPRPRPGHASGANPNADGSSATVTPIAPATEPTPLGGNRSNSTVTTGNGNRPRRDPNARNNANTARMNAGARLQQAEAQGIGRPSPLGGAAAAAEQLESAPLVDQGGEPGVGMSPQMREQLLQQLMSGAYNNGSSAGGGDAVGGGGGGSGSGSNGDNSGPNQSTGNGGGGGGGGGGGPSDPVTGGSTGPVTTDTTGTVSSSVRWVPIETPAGCTGTTGIRIADLYVRVNTPAPVTAVESGGAGAVRIANGAFYESATGTDIPPTSTNICDGVDSFLDLGGQSFIRLGSGVAFQPGQNGALTATWAAIAGVTPAQSPGRFGDSQYYMRIARIAAPAGASVAGQVLIAFRATETTPLTELNLVVPNCVECWDSSALPPGEEPGGEEPGGEEPGGEEPGGEEPGGEEPGGEEPGGEEPGGEEPGGEEPGGEEPGGEEPGGEEPGGEEPGGEEPDNTFDLVWLPITNTCNDPVLEAGDLDAYKTYDLYVRMGQPHRITIMDSGQTSEGLTHSGTIFQYPDYGQNRAPSKSSVAAQPCLAFDSYFDANGFSVGFFGEPDPDAWPSPVEAAWYPPPATIVRGTPNAAFGGDLYYYRIMRLTISPGTAVGGSVSVLGMNFDELHSIEVELPVPNLP